MTFSQIQGQHQHRGLLPSPPIQQFPWPNNQYSNSQHQWPNSNLAHQQALFSMSQQPNNQSNSWQWFQYPNNMDQPTTLPQTFNTMTLQDPNNADWYMDTGATAHLHADSSSLKSFKHKCTNSNISVLVGNGSRIPVTKIAHSTLALPFRTLILKNVPITPQIIKNLVSVRQFTRDNKCSIEFDKFGFSVKDFLTKRTLLRCDSTGDLYPVTKPSPQVFLSLSSSLWHQRLGHPSQPVLKQLISSNSISCNKNDSSFLCHACQLGKHTRLSFSLSKTHTLFPFQVIHSDVWTSPLQSHSGIKYYVVFIDQFSHFVWVYPLRLKSDVFSKFLHFRAYVKNQFNTDIQTFQCDNGKEYDNSLFHQLCDTNGIHIRFSCPYTSQQNGKSERMLRTLNNMIRTLLFQAHLPPTYWVESLHMSAHLLNILPSTSIHNNTPFHRLFNKHPSYSHLRVFGFLLSQSSF
ncbi:LOW QUALITY PROTEIN: retrovirus-related Pol polyprotein from transposon RE1 [Lactuca sativa]|uniref:LOW QUALITY PROTEIN: retrovirus-related Pol polyprotein from transposon RE1 n=1 Tax=Lactuca sativa TaxID=4236 RepID=UPI0022AF1389|nr:LOW QUALITY PROTEIN: retrovirus-related Pol polyprotein from transposon RE1 [Lactuca sativa]